MISPKLIFWLSTIQCIYGQALNQKPGHFLLNPGMLENPQTCPDEYKPVCAVTKTKTREYMTFKNECVLKMHNENVGKIWTFSNLGQCTNCPKCTNEENPVCHSTGPDFNDNKAFRNECYVRRYTCLHGFDSVFYQRNKGRCKICKIKHYEERTEDTPENKAFNEFIKRNFAWRTNTEDCKVDMSDLIAE